MSREAHRQPRRRVTVAAVVCALGLSGVAGCRAAPPAALATAPGCSLDDHALGYARLVAALARRDPRSVDSPPPRDGETLTAGLLLSSARDLRQHLMAEHDAPADRERVGAFSTQLLAFEARAEQIAGARLSYADERRRLLGDPPVQIAGSAGALAAARAALVTLDRLVPGRGPLAARLAEFDRRFTVSPERMPAVLTRAVVRCREATLRFIPLPADERLEIEFADGGSWSGFSRYHGEGRSTMSINPRYPLTVNRILDLACHEGYPGHHVINVLRDQQLVHARGWWELGLTLTFSPMSYAAESLASTAPSLAFTDDERRQIVRDELFPLAGLDPAGADRHVRVNQTLSRLDAATAAATEAYLLGHASRDDTIAALQRRAAMHRPEATLQFIDDYRAYATAYTAGRLAAWRMIVADDGRGEPGTIHTPHARPHPDSADVRAGQWKRYGVLALQLALVDQPRQTPGSIALSE